MEHKSWTFSNTFLSRSFFSNTRAIILCKQHVSDLEVFFGQASTVINAQEYDLKSFFQMLIHQPSFRHELSLEPFFIFSLSFLGVADRQTWIFQRLVLVGRLLLGPYDHWHTVHDYFDIDLHLSNLHNDKHAIGRNSDFDVFNRWNFNQFHSARSRIIGGINVQIEGWIQFVDIFEAAESKKLFYFRELWRLLQFYFRFTEYLLEFSYLWKIPGSFGTTFSKHLLSSMVCKLNLEKKLQFWNSAK